MLEHKVYMQRCIELAQLALGQVSPNPMVGCVIVYEGKVIGEGYHKIFGGPHAEVNAINDALNQYTDAESFFKNSTLYVSLEPCAHFGKTPPCVDLIIKYSFPEVIIGSTDPFEQVNGKGIERLRQAGIKVSQGVLEKDCRFLNRRFFTRVKKQRPYIILKWAQTANHIFAPSDGTQKWISSPSSKILSHKWRSEEDAILVGKNTAAIDNPQLNVREWTGADPKRIVIDRRLELPLSLNLFDQSQETIVFNAIKTELAGNIKYLELEEFDELLPQFICFQLYLMDIQSIIVEGGAKTLELFIQAGLWDEARIFSSAESWPSGIESPDIKGQLLTEEEIGSDTLRILVNNQA